jgi:glyoxylase-like metal-dependent hydrolase (beta-lactamase superfamily II)
MPVNRITQLGFVNCYLVEEDDGLTLVDTMLLAGGAERILATAETRGRPIVRIALTHAHADHVGALDAVAERLPAAEVSITARDARFLAGDRSLDPEERLGKPRGSYPERSTRPSRTLTAGERVGSLEVIAAPGHTPGHVAFLDTRDRTLYCGDAYSTLGGVAVPAKPYLRFPIPYFATWHRPTALESASALRGFDPARLAPGHGPVVESPGAAMDAAIARALD